MAAMQLLISLCVVGMAVAVPQRAVGPRSSSSSGRQQAIVSDVVTALQPSIAAAVANALRSVTGSSRTTSTNYNAERAQFEAEFASKNRLTGTEAARQKEAVTATQYTQEDVNPYPVYNFNYQVRDDVLGDYIYQEEARDGADVVGTYSFVDPDGTLITVNYKAGPEGFSQTRSLQENYLDARQVRPNINPEARTSSNAKTASNARTSSSSKTGSNSRTGSNAGTRSSFRSRSTARKASRTSSGGLDTSALVSEIIRALQPQISSTVNAALASQRA